MKRFIIAAALLGIGGQFLFAQQAPAPTAPPSFELPAALVSSIPEIPRDQNNLARFLAESGASSPERTKSLREASKQLRDGKRIEDEALLTALRAKRQLANDLLKPPLSFIAATADGVPTVLLSIYQLFQDTEALAQQALLENNRPEADCVLTDMLRWSDLLRNGQPTLLQAAASRRGWAMAFNAMLLDWQNHPAQARRLAEIEKLHAAHQLQRAELIETLKVDARFRPKPGELRKLLSNEPLPNLLSLLLRPPFDKVSTAELLKLPYDAAADFRRETTETLGQVECLQNNVPINQWPGFHVSVTGCTLEDYAKRPNGLGDLFYEQMDSSTDRVWSAALSREPLLEACLRWLKLEQDGQPTTATQFANLRDPTDGQPLSLDLSLRTIRTRGANQQVDPPASARSPLPVAGFATVGDDSLIVVPRWR